MITVTVPCLPPSTNNAYATVGRRRIPTESTKAFKELVQWTLKVPKCIPFHSQYGLAVSLTFYSNKWFTKAGTPRRIDVSNLEKLFVDAVFERLGLDDSHIFFITLSKQVGPEKSVMCITQLETP